MMLRKSIERLRNSEVAVQSPILAEKLTCYAGILAAEGSLGTAMTYLPENTDQVRSTFCNPTTKPPKRIGLLHLDCNKYSGSNKVLDLER